MDSGDYHWRSWRDTMREEGVELTYQQFLDSFGQKNDRILTTWMGETATGDVIRRIGDAKEALYRQLAVAEGLAPLPGAAAWVERLHAAGWKQSIASSAPKENVRVMLDVLDLDRYFDAIVSAEDVTAGKPDPQVFLAAAAKLDVPPLFMRSRGGRGRRDRSCEARRDEVRRCEHVRRVACRCFRPLS